MIIMTGFAGLAGTQTLLKNKRERLLKHFSDSFLESVPDYDPHADRDRTIEILAKRGIEDYFEAGPEGIFAALWEFGEKTGFGMRVDVRGIPIFQETIELSNEMDINPYEDDSTGCILFIRNGETADPVINELLLNNIAAYVIGYETNDRDRLLINGEEKRFLTPASRIEAEKKQRETYSKCRTK